MHKDFFVHIIRHKPALFRSILVFNGLDGSGYPAEPPASLRLVRGLDADALWNDKRARHRLIQGLGDDETGRFWDFSEESRRLALLPLDILTQAALQFGVAVHANELARLIAREDVLAARREIGPEMFAYALHRGKFQAGSLPRLFDCASDDLTESIRRHGRQALALCCSVWPLELVRLCAIRFTELAEIFTANKAIDSLDPSFDETPLPESRRAVWFGFKKILLKEVAPQWAPCFD